MSIDSTTVLAIVPLTTNIGAEVTGVDLGVPLSESTRNTIHDAFLRYHVLFFPGQHLDASHLAAAAAQFGELTQPSAALAPLDEDHHVVELSNIGLEPGERTASKPETWHVDITFQQNPPLAAFFEIVTQPEVGGDTLFASTQAAYDALSPAIQRLIDPLIAIHDGGATLATAVRTDRFWEDEPVDASRPIEHPVVAVHPLNGRRGLFVNPQFTRRIKGLSDIESKGLLDILFEHGSSHEFVVRRKWTEGEVAFWDNRAIWHRRVDDVDVSSDRRAYRVQLRGVPPVGPTDTTVAHEVN